MAKGILVTNTLNCSTFEKNPNPEPEQEQDVSKNLFETVPDIHPYRHSLKINIECKAKCLFNKDGVCVANGITVGHEPKTAMCYTHIKP